MTISRTIKRVHVITADFKSNLFLALLGPFENAIPKILGQQNN